jgi:hypothetical protein
MNWGGKRRRWNEENRTLADAAEMSVEERR